MQGTPSAYYPKKFRDYSIDDSKYVVEIFEKQLERREHMMQALGFDVFATLSHRCELDFHLYRYSIEGVRTNAEQIEEARSLA